MNASSHIDSGCMRCSAFHTSLKWGLERHVLCLSMRCGLQRLAVRVIVDSVAIGDSLISCGNCYSWARMGISSARSATADANLMSMLCTRKFRGIDGTTTCREDTCRSQVHSSPTHCVLANLEVTWLTYDAKRQP